MKVFSSISFVAFAMASVPANGETAVRKLTSMNVAVEACRNICANEPQLAIDGFLTYDTGNNVYDCLCLSMGTSTYAGDGTAQAKCYSLDSTSGNKQFLGVGLCLESGGALAPVVFATPMFLSSESKIQTETCKNNCVAKGITRPSESLAAYSVLDNGDNTYTCTCHFEDGTLPGLYRADGITPDAACFSAQGDLELGPGLCTVGCPVPKCSVATAADYYGNYYQGDTVAATGGNYYYTVVLGPGGTWNQYLQPDRISSWFLGTFDASVSTGPLESKYTNGAGTCGPNGSGRAGTVIFQPTPVVLGPQVVSFSEPSTCRYELRLNVPCLNDPALQCGTPGISESETLRSEISANGDPHYKYSKQSSHDFFAPFSIALLTKMSLFPCKFALFFRQSVHGRMNTLNFMDSVMSS